MKLRLFPARHSRAYPRPVKSALNLTAGLGRVLCNGVSIKTQTRIGHVERAVRSVYLLCQLRLVRPNRMSKMEGRGFFSKIPHLSFRFPPF